jgi:hypothetical protein
MGPRTSLVTILQPVHNPFEHVVDYLPIAVPKCVWTDHFGPGRFIDRLALRDGKLVHIET